jgi:splicing factor 3B subunit 1
MKPSQKIIDREDDYRRRRLNRIISPDRNDAYNSGDKTPDARVRTYADIMKEQQLARERDNTMQNIAAKAKAGELLPSAPAPPAAAAPTLGEKRKNRWDQAQAADDG